MSDFFEINDEQSEESEESELPSYDTPGRILVEISNILDKNNFHRYELTVHDYDSDTSIFWINEGVGFEYWFNECYFPCSDWYVVEGVVGEYIKGEWGFSDDDEKWEYTRIRHATIDEIKTKRLQ